MKSYISIVSKYLRANKKKTRLAITSVAISIALVTGIFSMLDFFHQFEKIQVIYDFGNYHISIENATEMEKQTISGRIDVQNSGTWISFRNGSINGKGCRIDSLDENFASNIHLTVTRGKYPVAENEMMIDEWASESLQLEVGDEADITFADKTEKKFLISGVYKDYASSKAKGELGVALSITAANKVETEKLNTYMIEFKKGVNVNAAQESIQSSLNLEDKRIGRNERLLAIMGQSKSDAVMGLYVTGAILFLIILIAGVIMIYNTFNISVMERVRQFGLLRCIGASKSQIKRIVKREGVYIIIRAIPVGICAGILIAFLCSLILKYYNSNLFNNFMLFDISILGIAAGILVGFLTVLIASSLPAKKAARVSPVTAVSGNSGFKVSKKKKQGLLMKIFHAEVAMGINNAILKKKTLFLMSCSIGISIIMFLGFQVLVDFMYSSMRTTKPYSPDITLTSEQGLSNELYKKLSQLDGVKKAYGRMFGYVDATFAPQKLTDIYIEHVGAISETNDGLFVPPEKSWLISYDQNQLEWARADLLEGELSEEKLDGQNGIIAVETHLRNNTTIETADFEIGDKVYIQTSSGIKEMKVMAILRSAPFSSPQLALTTFLTTEKLFTELTAKSTFQVIDIQLSRLKQEETINNIREMLDSSVSLNDQRQYNTENDQSFMTIAVFIYGFVIVIALISILNIINTMNTSVASKTRYLGVMRAIGMSGTQLDKMVLIEALTYSSTGCIAGCVLGVLLQKVLISNLLSQYHIAWNFPITQIILILIIVLIVTAVSILGPLKRIKMRGVSDVISSL